MKNRDANFYAWSSRKNFVVDDYAFKDMDSCGVLDLALPLGV